MTRDANCTKLRIVADETRASRLQAAHRLHGIKRSPQPGHCRIAGRVERVADRDAFHCEFSAREMTCWRMIETFRIEKSSRQRVRARSPSIRASLEFCNS